MPSAGPWRWVQWSWEEWMGQGRGYSVPHLIDPEKRSRRGEPMTACGLLPGRIVIEQTVYECPEGCCDKCRRAWRKAR